MDSVKMQYEGLRYVIAMYIRLSMEDAKTDSLSIRNQRLIIEKHIASLGIQDAEVMEFVDNGYSGTNFERPAVQELLSLVREGRIQCIIVKDFSRFGRNSIDTAYFIERVFPLFRTRFVSVSDSFDSDDHIGNTGGLDVAFKFMLHEYYSIDLSKKIKSAVHEKKRRGEYITKNCPFGYKKTGDRLEIDPPAAETVRMIYSLALEGKSAAKIAASLYEAKRPTPGEYLCRGRRVTPEGLRCVWVSAAIRKILTDEQYIGTYVAGKTQVLEVGSNVAVKNNASEWIRIPDHHPAIVEKTVFEAVQAMSQKKKPPQYQRAASQKRRENNGLPLRGKVVCGCCGHAMQLSLSRNAAFRCLFTRFAPDAECHRQKVSETELSTKVFEVIRRQAQVIVDAPDAPTPATDSLLEQALDQKRRLYERLVLREMGEDDYRVQSAAYDAELIRLRQTPAVGKREHECSMAREIAGSILTKRSLTREIADTLIESIHVFPDGHTEITWKVADFAVAAE